MKAEAYEMLAARENTYWWHRARRIMVRNLLQKYGLAQRPRWLDLGCGPGGNLALLDTLAPDLVVGADISPIARAIAKQKAPHASLVGVDIAQSLPFADNAFDLVTVFNVLYHAWVKSEAAVLDEAFRTMRNGALFLATEPAFAVLEREMDEIAMTRRRYRSEEFAGLCRAAGFDVLYAGYFTSFGFPLLLGLNWLGKFRSHDDAPHADQTAADMKALPGPLNGAMYAAARTEGFLIEQGLRMPLGTTLVCVARKP
jgi:SAM-dependent methyltransferase